MSRCGFNYLADVKDVFTGEWMGIAMAEHMTCALVTQALFRAVAHNRPPKGLIHHSDRGSQYCAHADQKMLRQFGMQPSMSRKGNCWDNAPMKSCWGSLKTELVHHRRFINREQAKREITEYIETFYNRIRNAGASGLPVARRFHSEVVCSTNSRLNQWTLWVSIDLSKTPST